MDDAGLACRLVAQEDDLVFVLANTTGVIRCNLRLHYYDDVFSNLTMAYQEINNYLY